ncbi:MAG: hypothetical protein DI547_04895 [Sphingobium sp.]|nr:MAG: hypothetical protein DI547_04895 [Sphingobium sp.]
MRSSLARYAGSMRDPDPDGARKLAAKLLTETGMIVLDPEWIESWGDREFVKAIANRVLKGNGGSVGKGR